MTTKCRWKNGIQEFYDSATFETLGVFAPIFYHEDFIGGNPIFETQTASLVMWETVEVNLNTAIGVVADGANGLLSLALDADSNAEDAVAYHGDSRHFNLKAHTQFEARLAMSVLPTTGVAVVFGMAGDHNLDKDSVTEAAWFRMDASGAVKVESDDTTNNNDDVSAGITLVAGEYHIFRIDFSDLSEVRFYIDGAHVGAGTTFDMSNLSATEAVMQPYFSLDKASGTGVGTMLIDSVKIWGKRSTQ